MIIPVGFAQANFLFTGAAVPRGAQVTLGVLAPGGMSAQTLANNVATAFQVNVLPELTQDVTLETVSVKLGPNDVGPTAEAAVGVAGAGGTQTTSPNVAYLVRKVTALGGRSNRGRWYLPGVNEADVLWNGIIVAARVTSLQTAHDDFYDALVVTGNDPVILHNVVGAPTAMTGFQADSLAATQRDRLR